MDPVTIGLGMAAVGFATNVVGSIFGSDANAELTAAQQKAERIKFQQMQSDLERRRRQSIRNGIIAQHQAVAATTASGANESSGASGAYGQVNQETGWNVQGANIAEHFGKLSYQANQEILAAKGDIAQAQNIQSIGSGLSSLGGGIVGNASTINSYFASNPTPIASSTSFGVG